MPLGVTGKGGVPGMPGGGVGKAGQGRGLTGEWFQTKPGGGGNPECKLPPRDLVLGFSYSCTHRSLAEGPNRQQWAPVAQGQSSSKEMQALAAARAGRTRAGAPGAPAHPTTESCDLAKPIGNKNHRSSQNLNLDLLTPVQSPAY